MTGDKFLARAISTVDETALRLAGTPRDEQEIYLAKLAGHVDRRWCEVFAAYITPADVSGMVVDFIGRIRTRRDQIEANGVGRA